MSFYLPSTMPLTFEQFVATQRLAKSLRPTVGDFAARQQTAVAFPSMHPAIQMLYHVEDRHQDEEDGEEEEDDDQVQYQMIEVYDQDPQGCGEFDKGDDETSCSL
jgi:hypothetical protein